MNTATSTAPPVVERDRTPSPTLEPQADPGDEHDVVIPPMGPLFVAPEDARRGTVADMTRELRRVRYQIAGMATGLAYRELDGRLLKDKLEIELRAAGKTKTDAERDAKLHPSYIAFCQATATLERRRAEAEATAECARLMIQARVATMTAEVL